MSIVTLTLAKSWLQIGHTQQDDVIQLLIDGAESFLAEHLNIKLTSDDYTEDLDSECSNDFQQAGGFGFPLQLGNGAPFLVPSNRPVTAVDTVLDLLNDSVELDFRQQGDLLAYTDANGNALGAWPPGLQRYRVAYTAGYDEDTVPKAIKQAVLMLVSRVYAARDGNNSMAATGSAVAYENLMDSAIVKLVQPFSRRRMATN